jgi:hypothetical protein
LVTAQQQLELRLPDVTLDALRHPRGGFELEPAHGQTSQVHHGGGQSRSEEEVGLSGEAVQADGLPRQLASSAKDRLCRLSWGHGWGTWFQRRTTNLEAASDPFKVLFEIHGSATEYFCVS